MVSKFIHLSESLQANKCSTKMNQLILGLFEIEGEISASFLTTCIVLHYSILATAFWDARMIFNNSEIDLDHWMSRLAIPLFVLCLAKFCYLLFRYISFVDRQGMSSTLKWILKLSTVFTYIVYPMIIWSFIITASHFLKSNDMQNTAQFILASCSLIIGTFISYTYMSKFKNEIPTFTTFSWINYSTWVLGYFLFVCVLVLAVLEGNVFSQGLGRSMIAVFKHIIHGFLIYKVTSSKVFWNGNINCTIVRCNLVINAVGCYFKIIELLGTKPSFYLVPAVNIALFSIKMTKPIFLWASSIGVPSMDSQLNKETLVWLYTMQSCTPDELSMIEDWYSLEFCLFYRGLYNAKMEQFTAKFVDESDSETFLRKFIRMTRHRGQISSELIELYVILELTDICSSIGQLNLDLALLKDMHCNKKISQLSFLRLLELLKGSIELQLEKQTNSDAKSLKAVTLSSFLGQIAKKCTVESDSDKRATLLTASLPLHHKKKHLEMLGCMDQYFTQLLETYKYLSLPSAPRAITLRFQNSKLMESHHSVERMASEILSSTNYKLPSYSYLALAVYYTSVGGETAKGRSIFKIFRQKVHQGQVGGFGIPATLMMSSEQKATFLQVDIRHGKEGAIIDHSADCGELLGFGSQNENYIGRNIQELVPALVRLDHLTALKSFGSSQDLSHQPSNCIVAFDGAARMVNIDTNLYSFAESYVSLVCRIKILEDSDCCYFCVDGKYGLVAVSKGLAKEIEENTHVDAGMQAETEKIERMTKKLSVMELIAITEILSDLEIFEETQDDKERGFTEQKLFELMDSLKKVFFEEGVLFENQFKRTSISLNKVKWESISKKTGKSFFKVELSTEQSDAQRPCQNSYDNVVLNSYQQAEALFSENNQMPALSDFLRLNVHLQKLILKVFSLPFFPKSEHMRKKQAFANTLVSAVRRSMESCKSLASISDGESTIVNTARNIANILNRSLEKCSNVYLDANHQTIFERPLSENWFSNLNKLEPVVEDQLRLPQVHESAIMRYISPKSKKGKVKGQPMASGFRANVIELQKENMGKLIMKAEEQNKKDAEKRKKSIDAMTHRSVNSCFSNTNKKVIKSFNFSRNMRKRSIWERLVWVIYLTFGLCFVLYLMFLSLMSQSFYETNLQLFTIAKSMATVIFSINVAANKLVETHNTFFMKLILLLIQQEYYGFEQAFTKVHNSSDYLLYMTRDYEDALKDSEQNYGILVSQMQRIKKDDSGVMNKLLWGNQLELKAMNYTIYGNNTDFNFSLHLDASGYIPHMQSILRLMYDEFSKGLQVIKLKMPQDYQEMANFYWFSISKTIGSYVYFLKILYEQIMPDLELNFNNLQIYITEVQLPDYESQYRLLLIVSVVVFIINILIFIYIGLQLNKRIWSIYEGYLLLRKVDKLWHIETVQAKQLLFSRHMFDQEEMLEQYTKKWWTPETKERLAGHTTNKTYTKQEWQKFKGKPVNRSVLYLFGINLMTTIFFSIVILLTTTLNNYQKEIVELQRFYLKSYSLYFPLAKNLASINLFSQAGRIIRIKDQYPELDLYTNAYSDFQNYFIQNRVEHIALLDQKADAIEKMFSGDICTYLKERNDNSYQRHLKYCRDLNSTFGVVGLRSYIQMEQQVISYKRNEVFQMTAIDRIRESEYRVIQPNQVPFYEVDYIRIRLAHPILFKIFMDELSDSTISLIQLTSLNVKAILSLLNYFTVLVALTSFLVATVAAYFRYERELDIAYWTYRNINPSVILDNSYILHKFKSLFRLF